MAVPSMGMLHQRFLEQDNDAAGDKGEKDGRIEVGDVIGHEDAGLAGGNAFSTPVTG